MSRTGMRHAPALLALASVSLAAAGGEPGRAPAPARPPRLMRAESTNVIDESLITLAESYLNADRIDDCVGVLERIASGTPDREMKSTVHFNLATLYETKLAAPERARAEYAKVTGRFAGAARGKILGPLRREKRWLEARDFLLECLDACEEPLEKAQVVRMLVGIARASGDEKLLEATLRSVPDLITYAEAQAAAVEGRERLKKLRDRAAAERRGTPVPPGANAPGGGARGAVRQGPPKRAPEEPKPRGERGLTPEQRAAAELEVEIRKLERAGLVDEAQRLREALKELGQDDNQDRF